MSIITLSRVHLCSAGSHVALFQISNFSLLQDLRPLNGFNAVPAQCICVHAMVSCTPPAHSHNSTEQRNIIVQSPGALVFCFPTSGCTTGSNPGNVTGKWKWEREKRRNCVENVHKISLKSLCVRWDLITMTGIIFLGWEKSALGIYLTGEGDVLWPEGCHAAEHHPKLESSKKQRKSCIWQERYRNRWETHRKTSGLRTKENTRVKWL